LSAYKGKGCEACALTGYHGRVGVFEVLEVDDKIRELIMSNANAKTIQQQAIANGMSTMLEDGIQKVLRGMTTLDEVLRVTSD
ncbi:MAG: type II secretion system protein GspE, partial [Patescibacteria group bacterium]